MCLLKNIATGYKNEEDEWNEFELYLYKDLLNTVQTISLQQVSYDFGCICHLIL